MEIRALQETDDRTTFKSGDPDLDRFFHQFAGQNQFRHHIGTTYVAVHDHRILGYATLSAGHIEIAELPATLSRRLPHYPLPILRQARLATDVTSRGKGIGAALLYAVFQLALTQSQTVGCIGILVDAKPDAVGWYRKYGFTPLEVVEGQSRSRPKPVPLFLSVATIQAAGSNAESPLKKGPPHF